MGAPGSDQVFVLLAGSVLYISAKLTLVTGGSGTGEFNPVKMWAQSGANGGDTNKTAAATSDHLMLCFNITGHAVPNVTGEVIKTRKLWQF